VTFLAHLFLLLLPFGPALDCCTHAQRERESYIFFQSRISFLLSISTIEVPIEGEKKKETNGEKNQEKAYKCSNIKSAAVRCITVLSGAHSFLDIYYPSG
jgi:hypothetical protein